MLSNSACVMVSLVLSLAVHARGLKLTLDKSQQGPYCGVLQCLADESNMPQNVLSVISLTIYDITRSNIPLKLASVSAFTPGVLVEASKINVINATGSVSKNQAGLLLALLSEADCLYASYQCELDFVNNNGQPDVLRETIAPADDNATILHILSEMSAQLKTQTEALNSALQEFTRIERFLNASCVPPDTSKSEVDKTHLSCYRGMPSIKPREKINVWNKTVSLCDTQTDGGGWILIQRRTRGDVSFFRSWNDYKKGFGTPDTDFWIGNDIIHNLTSQPEKSSSTNGIVCNLIMCPSGLLSENNTLKIIIGKRFLFSPLLRGKVNKSNQNPEESQQERSSDRSATKYSRTLSTHRRDNKMMLLSLSWMLAQLVLHIRGQTWHEFQGHCYLIMGLRNDSETCKRACKQYGSYMVEIEETPELNFVQTLVEGSSDQFWVGLEFNNSTRKFYWDLDEQEPQDSMWLDNEPNFSGRCVGLTTASGSASGSGTSYLLGDDSCTASKKVICEKNADMREYMSYKEVMSLGYHCPMVSYGPRSKIRCEYDCSKNKFCTGYQYNNNTYLCTPYKFDVNCPTPRILPLTLYVRNHPRC